MSAILMLTKEDCQLKFVEYDSFEYQQATQLRYRLFYQKHGIAFESLFSSQEKQNFHLVIKTKIEQQILAYGRLDRKSSDEFQICQIVVEPKYQRQGLGTIILSALIKAATEQGASLVMLNARVEKVQFYQRFGFQSIEKVFASSLTGVLHIKMQQKILCSSAISGLSPHS